MTTDKDSGAEPPVSGIPLDQDVLRRLGEEIDFARLAPGQSITIEDLSRRLQTTREQTVAAAAHFAGLHLLSMENEIYRVAPIVRDHLLQRLDCRLVLEQQVAEAAALRSKSVNITEIEAAAVALKRSAMVGDIDGYMMADRRLERSIAAAAQMPEVSEEVFVLKREFRRAWCAYNRLRDLNVPAGYRQALVTAVLNGDVVAAKAAVQRFIDYLRQSY